MRTTRTPKVEPYGVFLSYSASSSEDRWIVKEIARKLKAARAVVWIDEKDLGPGKFIVEEIISGIDACKELVVLLSEESIKSPWVSFEIAVALGQRKQVTPILYRVATDKMPIMGGIKAIGLNQLEVFCSELRRRIARADSTTFERVQPQTG